MRCTGMICIRSGPSAEINGRTMKNRVTGFGRQAEPAIERPKNSIERLTWDKVKDQPGYDYELANMRRNFLIKFTFNRGNWEEGHALPEWHDGEDNIDYVSRLGYSTVGATYGTEYGGEIEIYEGHDNKSFYALVSPTGNTSFEVFLPDFPSYMLFMKEYVAAFAAGGTDSMQKDIMGLLSKFFQAEHGHDESDICSRCDPAGWKRRLEAARQRQAG